MQMVATHSNGNYIIILVLCGVRVRLADLYRICVVVHAEIDWCSGIKYKTSAYVWVQRRRRGRHMIENGIKVVRDS